MRALLIAIAIPAVFVMSGPLTASAQSGPYCFQGTPPLDQTFTVTLLPSSTNTLPMRGTTGDGQRVAGWFDPSQGRFSLMIGGCGFSIGIAHTWVEGTVDLQTGQAVGSCSSAPDEVPDEEKPPCPLTPAGVSVTFTPIDCP